MYGSAKRVAGVDFHGLRPKKGLAKTVPLGGGGDATDCAGVGFGAIRAGGFLPVKAAGKPWRACTQYDPKVILGAKTLDPKGDEYCGS